MAGSTQHPHSSRHGVCGSHLQGSLWHPLSPACGLWGHVQEGWNGVALNSPPCPPQGGQPSPSSLRGRFCQATLSRTTCWPTGGALPSIHPSPLLWPACTQQTGWAGRQSVSYSEQKAATKALRHMLEAPPIPRLFYKHFPPQEPHSHLSVPPPPALRGGERACLDMAHSRCPGLCALSLLLWRLFLPRSLFH